MKLSEIREKFLKFFIDNNHQHIPSSPLVPENDPTLMFTNSGMVQFKNIFTGKQQTDIKRAVSSQKCLRIGGKHNDLETVGYTSRHHTFFEMLGNFSFGDYFKETAIELAWNFITKELSLDKKRLSVTIYHTDNEAYKIWRKVSGLKDEKIIKISTDDNFWSMGNTGPCGPCSEIFYDHGCSHLSDEDRVVEIWNLVFMEFDKDIEGNLHTLPKKCIDTGMGIERITAVLQNVYDNYDTDFFTTIISQVQKYCKSRVAHKIIADHLRAAAFLIAEGILPGNEGKSYILRRLIRRAARYFECDDPLLYRIFSALINSTSPIFTEAELLRAKDLIEATLKAEEENFKDTLIKGVHMLEKYTTDLNPGNTLAGELVFKLYDTYGFPVDITLDILKEKKINFDQKGFDDAMKVQKTRSKWSGSGEKSVDQVWLNLIDKFGSTKFIGYENNEISDAKILNIISNENKTINEAYSGNEVTIILDKTPFYGESGGQLGDIGTILNTTNNVAIVKNTYKIHNLYLHQCIIKSGIICNGDIVVARIDQNRRDNLSRNHSVTHLLHFALRNVLGNHVTQKGSLVAPDRIRFDFSHNTQVNYDQLYLIEDIVNNLIRENYTTFTKIQNMDQAVHEGAMALFGEKYSDQVRVVKIGNSKELCGGTHVQHTGEIGLFKIITESSVAFGIRRIEALTGQEAINYIRNNEITLKKIAEYVKVPVIEVTNRLIVLNQERKKSEAKTKSLYKKIVDLENIKNISINNINFLSNAFVDIPAEIIRDFVLHKHIVKTVIAFTTSENKKNILIVRVSKDLTDIISAKTLITNVISKNCGGTAELAQAGYHNGNPITSICNYLRDKI